MRTKQRDTFLKSKMLSTVRNKRLLSRKRPLAFVFFLKCSLILLRKPIGLAVSYQ